MQDEGTEYSNSFALMSNGHNFPRRMCRLLNNVFQEKVLGGKFESSKDS